MLGALLKVWRHIIISCARLLDLRGRVYLHQRVRKPGPAHSSARPRPEEYPESLFSAGLLVRESWVEAGDELRNAMNSCIHGR